MTMIQSIMLVLGILAVGVFIGWIVTSLIMTRADERRWDEHIKTYREYQIACKEVELYQKKQCLNLVGTLQIAWRMGDLAVDRLNWVKTIAEQDKTLPEDIANLLATGTSNTLKEVDEGYNAIGKLLLKMNSDNPNANGEEYKYYDDQVRKLDDKVSRLKREYADTYHEEYPDGDHSA